MCLLKQISGFSLYTIKASRMGTKYFREAPAVSLPGMPPLTRYRSPSCEAGRPWKSAGADCWLGDDDHLHHMRPEHGFVFLMSTFLPFSLNLLRFIPTWPPPCKDCNTSIFITAWGSSSTLLASLPWAQMSKQKGELDPQHQPRPLATAGWDVYGVFRTLPLATVLAWTAVWTGRPLPNKISVEMSGKRWHWVLN